MIYSYNASSLEAKSDPDQKGMPRKKYPTIDIDEADIAKIFGKIPEDGASVTLTAYVSGQMSGGKYTLELDIEEPEAEDTSMDDVLGYNYSAMSNPKPVPVSDPKSLTY